MELFTKSIRNLGIDGVSIVIPCYNPGRFLLETIASVRAQTFPNVEIVLVNDGTDTEEGLELLSSAYREVDRYIVQPNRGLAAARNTGFHSANFDYVVPLDADDLLRPGYVSTCVEAAAEHADAAFVYTDYEVFGTQNYTERLLDYNLFHLLDRNTLTYAALIRRRDWEDAGGYDESMASGYEDWEFWLNLGLRGRFGHHVAAALFRYRKHGFSLFDSARAQHDELVERIRTKHPETADYPARARIKACWDPAVCILDRKEQSAEQTILDCDRVEAVDPGIAALTSRAGAFLAPGTARQLDPASGEFAALAVWAGQKRLTLPDGSIALSRQQALRSRSTSGEQRTQLTNPPSLPRGLEKLHRHLVNAELLSVGAWTRHPLRSASRLVPLRVKEAVNRRTHHRVFDLTFYLRFHPASVLLEGSLIDPLFYMPPPRSHRKRIGLITPHLGPGGAETVLLDMARSLDRNACELFVIATQSRDARWLPKWKEAADHVYDLEQLVGFERVPAAMCSIVANWQFDSAVIQNALVAYGLVPHLKKRVPGIRIMDLVHAADDDWDILTATREVANQIDLRIVVSELLRTKLLEQGVPEERIRLIRNGVDTERFSAPHENGASATHRILFAGRLDPVKRPHLLVEIGLALKRLRGKTDFRFVVVGDGPEANSLARRVRKRGLQPMFEFRGHVSDVTSELANCEMLVLPSRTEGSPLIVLEALASARPVVASAVGGIPEILDKATGFLIPRCQTEVWKFADAIDTLMRQPQLRRTMGENGRRLVQTTFNREASREAYRELLEAGNER